MARLIIFEESNQQTVFETFELSDSSILIGSDPENHLILKTPDIDSSHASLELRDNRWVIQDLGGPGGTMVNGEEIHGPRWLRHADLIELGFIKMKFDDPERKAVKKVRRKAKPRANDVVEDEADISGRVWFATVAAATGAVIFIIIFLLVVAHFLELISITDLLPPWLLI